MFLRKTKSRSRRRWRRALGLLLGLAVIAGIASMTHKQASSAVQEQPAFTAQADSQLYSEDLTIGEDEVFDDDVVVFSGNVRIKAGGVVKGDLVVYSGNIQIDDEGKVEGDVTSLSGNLDIAGTVDGDLSVFSGDVELAETAMIGGDISVMSGSIDRERGATVEGNVVAGGFKMPQLPNFFGAQPGEVPVPAIAPVQSVAPIGPSVDMAINRAGGLGGALFALFGRLVAAAFGASVVIFLAGLLYHLRPGFIHAVQQTLQDQRPLSFAVGITMNVVLTFLTGVLLITLCLAPVGLAAGLLFAVINLVGWATLSLTVGQWLLRSAKIETKPLVALVIGAFLMTGVLALGWALGGCFRPIAYLVSLGISAFGGGAVVVYWLKLGVNKPADDTALTI